MKHCVAVAASLFSFSLSQAQSVEQALPERTVINPYSIGIGFNKTTVLLFPAPVQDADRGRQDVMIARQPGVNNVVKVKAARKGFEPTNLHVFTKDGRLYTFEVFYKDEPGHSTFDLSRMDGTSTTSTPLPAVIPEIGKASSQFRERLRHIRNVRPFYHASTGKFNMRLKLRSIHFDSEHLYFHYRLYNRSNIPYLVDFSRMYITDGRKVKRSTSQQQEIVPLNATEEKLVPGNSNTDFVFVMKRFTIPDAKKFKVEFFEHGGGRHITMNIKNRHIFRARPLF